MRVRSDAVIRFHGPDADAGESHLSRDLQRHFRESARHLGARLVSQEPFDIVVTFDVHVDYAYPDVVRADVESRMVLRNGDEKHLLFALPETRTSDFALVTVTQWQASVETDVWPRPEPLKPRENPDPSIVAQTLQKHPPTPMDGRQPAARRPRIPAESVVAIMDIRGLSEALVDAASSYFVAAATRKLGWRVVPRAEVLSVLRARKRESYQLCYQTSCRIELGRALAASLVLIPKRLEMDGICALTANLFDLRTESTVASTNRQFPCSAPIFEAIDHAIHDLFEATHPPSAADSKWLRGRRRPSQPETLSLLGDPDRWPRNRDVGLSSL